MSVGAVKGGFDMSKIKDMSSKVQGSAPTQAQPQGQNSTQIGDKLSSGDVSSTKGASQAGGTTKPQQTQGTQGPKEASAITASNQSQPNQKLDSAQMTQQGKRLDITG